jgi:hypothetical protein
VSTHQPGTDAPGQAACARPSTDRTDPAKRKRARTIRWWGLLAVLVAITGVGVLHQYGGIRLVGVDALCPFGGIETFWTLLTAGTLVKQIAVSSLILLAAVLVIAIVFRRAFCGQICPLGALQELAGKLGGRLRRSRKPLVVPHRLDRAARYLKYAVLAFFTLWTFQAAALVIRPYDPWVAWMHLSTTEVWAEFGIGLAKAYDYRPRKGATTYTKYMTKLSLPYTGKWRIRAYHAPDSKYGPTYTSYRYITVR